MLRHITVISSDGLTIYHKSFVKNEMDDVLFSALTGAIIAFSRELGDELNAIQMKKQMIFFVTSFEHIIIFSLEVIKNVNQREITRKLNLAVNSKHLIQICRSGIGQNINRQLESELQLIFDMDHDLFTEKDIATFEELTGDAFIDALNKLDSI